MGLIEVCMCWLWVWGHRAESWVLMESSFYLEYPANPWTQLGQSHVLGLLLAGALVAGVRSSCAGSNGQLVQSTHLWFKSLSSLMCLCLRIGWDSLLRSNSLATYSLSASDGFSTTGYPHAYTPVPPVGANGAIGHGVYVLPYCACQVFLSRFWLSTQLNLRQQKAKVKS